ncbi:MAG TPA: J domain-containing protein [bacterium]|nr:J domain-containing protein [bacterium]
MRFRPNVDYYEILQVHPHASAEMVRKAYRTLMGEMGGHPDLGGDEERAKLINEAYSVLGDPDIRRAYDQARARVAPRGYGGAGSGWPGTGRRASSGSSAAGRGSGGELERWSAFVNKLLFSAIVVMAGLMIARLITSPAVDLADMVATIVVLLRIWQQAGGGR